MDHHLSSASQALARWQGNVCMGDHGDSAGLWCDGGLIVTAGGAAVIGHGTALPRCGRNCPWDCAPGVVPGAHHRPDLASLSLRCARPGPPPPCAALWQGTYLLQRLAGVWRIQMFAADD